MPVGEPQQWIEQKLQDIEQKREILNSLKDTLTKWEQDLDWEAIPTEKQAALMALADESVQTLTALIERLGNDIRREIGELPGQVGERQSDE